MSTRPAYYWSSDNPHPHDATKHSHLGIGKRYSRFKLGKPITWEGLRLCFHDPEVRIRQGTSEVKQEIQHPVLERICFHGGFLSDTKLELTPNLNCVIGGRGTGKSTLLELIRYAFGIQPKTTTNAKQAEGILQHTFPPGSQVIVDFRLGDGTSYRVERTTDRPPQVFRCGGDVPLNVAPADMLPLQVYGQKEIYEISQEPEFQLRLLDNYVNEALKPLQHQEDNLLRQLRDSATSILGLQEDIDANQEKLDRLGVIGEELRRMEQQQFVKRMEQKKHFDQEKYLLDQTENQIKRLFSAIETFINEQQLNLDVLKGEILTSLPNQKLLQLHREMLEGMNLDFHQTLCKLKDRIMAKWAEGETFRESWLLEYQAQDEAYQRLLREFQESAGGITPDRYIKLQEHKLQLEELQRKTQKKRATVEHLYNERKGLLAQLRQVRQHQYEVRRDKATELSELLRGKVRITVHPQGHRESYATYLKTLFSGLNVRITQQVQLAKTEAEIPEREAQRPVNYQGEKRYLIPRIPRYLDPIDLAEAIRTEQEQGAGEESLLKSCFEINSEPMRRNIAKLSQEQVFDLETFRIPDLPVIELQVAGGQLGYRHLSNLSIGQKCTALLSIVLLESPATLLIDQPEDDLDNHFIFDQIVATLRREKERRQFVIATHNANIPVSGDAELIMVFQADEKHGWVEEEGIGSIDAQSIKGFVEGILEGGEDAFRIRKEKYGIT